MVEVIEIMVTSFKISLYSLPDSVPPTLQQSTINSCLCQRLLDTYGQVWFILLWGHSLLLSPGSWCTQGSVCALQVSVFPVLCKFLWLYGGVNGDRLQEGLCHTQVCCTKSPCPCVSPLLICSFAGDTQTQFWSVSAGSLCPGADKVCLRHLSISGG